LITITRKNQKQKLLNYIKMMLKIKINENENYSFEISNELNLQEFMELYNKFEKVMRLIKISNQDNNLIDFQKQFNNRTNIVNSTKRSYHYNYKDNPNQRRSNENPFINTREKTLDLLQYAYHGNKEDKQRISKLMNRSWNEIQKIFGKLLERYSITPDEIGLTQIPNNINRQIDKRIPNYIIKSYTGIFDEK